MKLYYSPGACSMASHIILNEVGQPFTIEKVNLRSKETETGADYRKINVRGAVPALMVDNGEVLTEGAAILQYIADTAGAIDLAPPTGTMARARVQEMLNYVASEVHKAYSPLFAPNQPDEIRAANLANVARKLVWMETVLSDGRPFLTGQNFTVADAYAFVVVGWSPMLGVDLAAFPNLSAFLARVGERPSVAKTLKAEGLAA